MHWKDGDDDDDNDVNDDDGGGGGGDDDGRGWCGHWQLVMLVVVLDRYRAGARYQILSAAAILIPIPIPIQIFCTENVILCGV